MKVNLLSNKTVTYQFSTSFEDMRNAPGSGT